MAKYSHHAIAWSKEFLLACAESRPVWLICNHRVCLSSVGGRP